MAKIISYIITGLGAILLITNFHTPLLKPAKKISVYHIMATRTISLEKRYSNAFVNDVFKDNILLTLQYMDHDVDEKKIDWSSIEKPFQFEIQLQPDTIFAFHDKVLPEYQGKIAKTTGAHFNGAEGFKSDGYLTGDGVCHLASLMNWVARDAGLDVTARVNHNFANIPEVPKEYGTSIMTGSGNVSADEMQNLYIKNNQKKTVVLRFNFDGANLTIAVAKS